MRTIGTVSVFVCAIVIQARSFGGVEVQGNRVIIETERGRAVLDRGVVTEMTNRLTGETYTRAVETPRRDVSTTGLLWHNAPVFIDENVKVTCEKRGANEALISAALADGHGLTLSVAVDPATQDVLIRQSGSGKRKGLYGIQWGIGGLDAGRVRTLVPGNSGVCLDRRCPVHDMHFSWPSAWEVQMMVVEGSQGGFAVWSQDTEMRFKSLKWQRKAGEVALGFQTHNFAPFDELTSVESVEWRLAFFKGDWRVPAKRYREWMEKTYALTRLENQQPSWVKDIRFLVIMGMEAKVLDALKAHVRPEATLLYIPAWRRDGYDQNYPDYTADEKFGEFVRYARSLGYHVMPHMNYFGCHEKNPAYERMKQWHMRNPFTKELDYWVPPRLRTKKDEEIPQKFAYINPASKAWRDELTQRLVEAQRKYGFDAIHLDQTLGIMNDANGKIDGVYCAQGNVLLHRQLREAMPEVALSGEGLDEVTCRYEAFAQRHAAYAVDHVYGTWNDEFIACGHPISSYFLTPYTKIYGYLGMCNPSHRGLYLAWKRAYENWGVVPTYSRPSVIQIEGEGDPSASLRAGLVKSLLREAQTWVADELVPDFEGEWRPHTKFRLKGNKDVAVVYEGDEVGGSRMMRIAGGRENLVYAVIRGRNVVEGTGSIGDWFAYDEKKIFGLDPENAYIYLDEPRNLHASHIARVPEGTLVRVLMMDEKKFSAEFEGLPEQRSCDFIRRLEEAETGIVVDGKRGELEHGASFQPGMSTCGDVLKRSIFAHPPWKMKTTGPEPARTYGRYTVTLLKDCRAFLEFAIGLRDGVDGRSDGVQFRVEINDEGVFDETWARSEWKPVDLPLDRWRGQQVRITFITTTGPKGNASFDWALWGEPRILFELAPKRIDIRFACEKNPVELVLGSDPALKWRQEKGAEGMCFYDVNLEMPGRAVFLWEKPRPVALPLDLAKAPFTVSLSVSGAPARPPIQHAGASPGEGTSGGTKKRGLNAHPPDHGRASVDYLLQLPNARPITLAFAVGLRDGSKSDSVIFIVEANGKEVCRQQVTKPDGWHPAKVDLSSYSGKPLLLSLVVDSDGPFYYDWATWAEPELRTK